MVNAVSDQELIRADLRRARSELVSAIGEIDQLLATSEGELVFAMKVLLRGPATGVNPAKRALDFVRSAYGYARRAKKDEAYAAAVASQAEKPFQRLFGRRYRPLPKANPARGALINGRPAWQVVAERKEQV